LDILWDELKPFPGRARATLRLATVSPGDDRKKLRHLCALAIQKNASVPVATGTLETILKAKDVL